MVVASVGIHGYACGIGRLCLRVIVGERTHHHCVCLRVFQEFSRVAADSRVVFKIAHAAIVACGNPSLVISQVVSVNLYGMGEPHLMRPGLHGRSN